MDFDFTEITAALAAMAASVWAAYQNFDEQKGPMKAALIFGPIVLIAILLIIKNGGA